METIAAGLFKAKCLRIMDQVQSSRQPITITKQGKPVARLVPVDEGEDSLFGFYSGRLRIIGDVTSPTVPETDWKRLR